MTEVTETKKPNVIHGLFNSKKFLTTVLGVAVFVTLRAFMPEMEAEELMALISPVVVYLVGQGAADFGKERAKIECLTNNSVDRQNN